ncbi:sce7725 family protein [Tetragenococcus solitarius]|uniref:Sce7725 family protein n=1 Tax=Tetragenococcus solitarius TaxID=71453 RepID=A0ABN3Y3D0_9ENTE|nr:sce7725 family protein [Tetragenococcus solitarius]
MYYPYFRGKQFDLLALRALLEQNLLSKKIQPIIEPVKHTTALQKLFEIAQKQHYPIYLIENPQVGDFNTETGNLTLQSFSAKKALIVDQPLETIEKNADLWIVNQPSAALTSDWSNNQKKVLVPPEFRLLNTVQGEKVLSVDHFTRLPKPSFYQEKTDEFFSNDHLIYKQRGFTGFSDFSIDSRIYYEKGYPSPLLSLHIVYFDQKTLRIHHFLSPEDLPSQKEKFLVLMQEVKTWQKFLAKEKMTAGLTILFDYAEKEKFPGLGVMRKAAVMHHMEIMSRYLEEKDG